MSKNWRSKLKVDPIPTLLTSQDEALIWFVQRDLLGEQTSPIEKLWKLPAAERLMQTQQPHGAWRYPGHNRQRFTYVNYDLLETFRSLGVLVEQYGFDRTHTVVQQATGYIVSCQTDEGDIRGILGNQYMPYYHGAILALLIQAGYHDETFIQRGMEWLLAMRQADGGWIVPVQALPADERSEDMWRGAPVPPQRDKPFSHLATGMALRPFALHPTYRYNPEARHAIERLKQRFFKPDRYNDRKAAHYWFKFQYPFWWTNLLSALDTLSWMGFPPDDEAIAPALEWFVAHQQDSDNLWDTGYGKGKKAALARGWVGLAICRVFRRFYP